MHLQNTNTYHNQFSFKSCIKYKQAPNKLPRKTMQLINKVHDCNEYLKSTGENPIYFLAYYNPKALEGIQKGISVFKGLNMTEISFVLAHINEVGILRGCFNNCAHCYAEGSYPRKNTENYISRMSWKDYKDLTEFEYLNYLIEVRIYFGVRDYFFLFPVLFLVLFLVVAFHFFLALIILQI